MLRMSLAQSPIPGTTVTLERLRKRGYVSLLEMYEKIAHPEFFGKLLYTRPAWFILNLSKDTWYFDRLNRTVRGDALHCAEVLEASLSKCSSLGEYA
jgi:hypothetical protein